MIGAIAGDVIGSAYEFNPTRDHDFELFTPKSSFTDDTVLTMANALWLIDDEQHTHERLVEIMLDLCRRYPNRGYGGRFANWICDKDPQPYNSYGNGSAMRVSPVGYYAQSLEEALALAKVSAEVTHNHPEGIKGAQATAAAIFLARRGKSKQEIRDYVAQTFDYDLSRTLDEIRPTFTFDETCQRTVPEAITCFMEGKDYEDVVRLSVALAGDADTIAAIAGSISSAVDEVPNGITQQVIALLSEEFCTTLLRFNELVAKREQEAL
ncbi:MAG: dinitrogenase reductase [Bacteroidales bacterium]|nr:dinitrogenase reductase [Bacteroidales bacterium]MBQ1746638.1 ADP-ribosylglycohydrolase family protein [Muribaculaceae bacterium]